MGEGRSAYRILVGRPEGRRPLGRPRRRWEDNIKMDLQEVGSEHGLDLYGSWEIQVAGSCECGNEPSGFYKTRGISWLADDLLASEEGLCSLELVS
jgi:hypothetical protein